MSPFRDNGSCKAYQSRNGITEGKSLETTMPIAIIGMSCRFPGDATSPEKLWQLCADGRSAWSEIPPERFNQDAFYHPQGENMGTSNVKGGHFLKEDVSLFDASFFNFSTEVASSMDPQYRLQLESTFEALESGMFSGLPLSRVAGSDTSVFAGAFFRDYHDSLMRDPETLPRYFMTGNGAAMISNRISHFFDLRGPSVTVDTGCSTALTALHLACQGIRVGESKMSIVGGANVMLNPDMFISMSSLGLLGSDGKSYTFDSRALGYGRGEGVATVIIKPLQDALRDGDPIRAVLRETALNQDGKTPTITSPSQDAQEDLIRACYQRAGLNPLDTSYVEAHGTGTRTGDPIEAGAIGSVLGRNRPSDKPLYIGSVKSNVGHLEAASGLAAIVKVAMSFEKGFIPPSINFEHPNPSLHLNEWRLQVPRKLEPWPAAQIRRASLSNFGYGGTNAHVILDDPVLYQRQSSNEINGYSSNGVTRELFKKSCVFPLSAKDEGAARSMITNLRDYLKLGVEQKNGVDFHDLAYTLGQRRTLFPWVAASPARSVPELVKTLEDTQFKPRKFSEVPRLGFVFNGQGAQWHAMGRELIVAYPVFTDSIRRADQYLKDLGAPWSLVEELMRDAETTRVNEPILSLPLCCAIQISLVELLRSWGIKPTAVTGHSSGEVGAAYAAGAIDFREALAIVYVRGALTMNYLKKAQLRGGMLAVGMGPADVEPYLSNLSSGKVVVACINSPSSVTISGDLQAIEDLEARILEQQVFARKLKVDAAYHSHHMLPLAKDYLASLRQNLKHDRDFNGVLYSSPVTGTWVGSAQELGPEHWKKNMVQPVLFAQSFRNMCIGALSPDLQENKQHVDTIIEIGPHGALAGPIRQMLSLPELKSFGISYGSCLSRGQDAVQTMQELACFLLCKGCPVDLSAVNFPTGCQNSRVLRDLPSYPWNHAVRHWVEPRLNREYRHRKYPPHDLLGSLIMGGNPMAPTWRHIIRPSEIPWVRDHLVQSDIVYPGAGCISMAIEAVRQMSLHNDKSIAWYKLRDIKIMKALVIPDTSDGIEVQLSLRDCSDKLLDAQKWQEFHIYSYGDDREWNEHCQGLIAVDFKPSSGDAPPQSGPPAESVMRSKFDADSGAYTRRVDPKRFFKSLQSIGINHGPSFQNLLSIRSGQDLSLAAFTVADSASLMPSQHQQEHLVHPITLDALFLAAYSAVPEAGTKQMGAAIPRSIKTMYVSAEIHREAGHHFQTLSTLHRHSPQGFDVSIATIDEGDPECLPVMALEGLHYQSLGATYAAEESSDDARLCLTIQWESDLSLIRPKELEESLKIPPDATETAVIRDLKRASYYFIHDALACLNTIDIQSLDWHHKTLYDWMKLHDKRASLDQLAPKSSKWVHSSEGVKQALLDRVASQSINGEMLCRIGRNLVTILRKEMPPLELMLEDKLLYSYYEKALRVDRSLMQVEQLVKLFAHKYPRGKILEIGGGTGACTGTVLRALGGGDSGISPCFAHYDFTDISSGFFETAREKFSAWGDMISYRKLDVEQDPVEQSFELSSYDLVIACQVLHATKDMKKTMTNVRRLLKAGGKLIMVETTQDAFDVQLVFGTLPGWWLSAEPERKYSPNLSVDLWERFLTQTGFSGLDVEVRDCEDEENYAMSVIMSTATIEVSPSFHPETVLICGDSNPPELWLNDLKRSIRSVTSLMPEVGSFDDTSGDGKVCIVIGEITQPILSGMDAAKFTAVTDILNHAKGVLWVTRGGAINCERPETSLHSGLLRTLRLEDCAKRYISLDLDPNNDPWTSSGATAILDVFKATFDYSRDPTTIDFEYAERGSRIQVPRLHDNPAENSAVANDTLHLTPEMQAFHQPGRELRMTVGTPGLLDSLVFFDDPSAGEPLPDDFVEIEPKAFGLNFRDIMVTMGQLQETVMGFECSGVITRVGPNATHDFKVGDRVCALTTRGHWANFIRISWAGVGRIPDHMPFEVAASIPMVFVTAYYSLFDTARLQKGETVLIHAATGGVGQAAIILAQTVGAEIFATVGSNEKRDFIMENYGIRPDHIFNSRDISFATNIMAATKGKGVDVVLNSLAGKLLQESWHCVAYLGRFVEIGKRDIQLNKNLEMEHFGRAISFSAIDLIHLGNHKGPVMFRVLKDILHLLGEKTIVPIKPITVYPISEIQRAFRQMQAGKHLGKIVIKPNQGDLVKVVPQSLSANLSPDASYLVVGGLGGIGRSISQWIVRKGAKNLILLSRGAASQPNSRAFIDELGATGCKIMIRNCDIAERSDLARVISDCAKEMPPVRGVIQGAMVLRDSVFERMPFENWEGAIRPKVQGTINLQDVLSNNKLDFFIMLSSATGILGNASQGNYAAGGTFQDAFARSRAAKCLPAVSIDLGMVESVGYVAETKGVAERLAKIGYRPLKETEVLQTIESAIRTPIRQPHNSQIITGLATYDSIDDIKWREDMRFAALKQNQTLLRAGDGHSRKKNGDSFKESLTSAPSWMAAVGYVTAAIIKKLSDMFMIPEAEIDESMPMAKYGVDSLVAVELRNWLVSRAQAEMSIFDVLQSASLVALAGKVAAKSRFVAEAGLVAPVQ